MRKICNSNTSGTITIIGFAIFRIEIVKPFSVFHVNSSRNRIFSRSRMLYINYNPKGSCNIRCPVSLRCMGCDALIKPSSGFIISSVINSLLEKIIEALNLLLYFFFSNLFSVPFKRRTMLERCLTMVKTESRMIGIRQTFPI